MLDRTLTVRVASIRRLSDEVSAFELVHPAGRALPGYSAGAHIDVELPGGFKRSYSLAAAPAAAAGEQRSYLIAVKRESAGRGGSAALHARVGVNDLLAIGTPRNTFPLAAEAKRHLLLAGGIGLTPLLAMAQQLARHDTATGTEFTLCVFARSREHLALASELAALAPRVRYHFDAPADAAKLDLDVLLGAAAADTGSHLYLCGPEGFMRAVLAAAARHGFGDDRIHLEYFAPPDTGAEAGSDEPFTLVLAGRGIEVAVSADQSAVAALHDLGIEVPTSCEQGVCGTCVVRWRTDAAGSGEPEHRDHCLSATERRGKVALCCSRAKGGRLVIEV